MNAYQLNEDGVIVNIIVVDDLDVFPNLINVDDYPEAKRGDSIIEDTLVPLPEPEVNLPALKLAKWEEIKAFRTNLLNNGGFPCSGHWYHSDPAMKTEFLGLKLKALETMFAAGDMEANIQIDGTNTLVKTMDNGYMPITGTDILAIVSAAEVQTKNIYTAAATHQYYLNISVDTANYSYSTGWPAIYGEE